jgi:hypothetical protein
MNKSLIILYISLFSVQLFAQEDTTAVNSNNLLDELTQNDSTTVKLLPDHIIPTQRLMWGPRGIMRNFNAFELSPQSRELELKIRRTMFVSHQIVGFCTLGAMVAQGIVGSKLYNGDAGIKNLHEGLATGINIGYSLTAFEALFAPPKMINDYKGYSSIKVHKYLAILHLTGMIATNVLAGMLEDNPSLKPYHRAAAFTTFGSLAAAMIIIKF